MDAPAPAATESGRENEHSGGALDLDYTAASYERLTQLMHSDDRGVSLAAQDEVLRRDAITCAGAGYDPDDPHGNRKRSGRARQPAKKPAFKLLRAGLMEARAPDWLVEGVIERDSLAVLYGPTGEGKTHWSTGLGVAVASDTDFHGAAVKSAPVVLINGEGHRGIVCRQKAHETAWGVDLENAPLYVSGSPAMLCDQEHVDLVRSAVDQVASKHGSVGLVIVDTLARNFGGDENSTADMSRFVAHLDQIRADHGCAILVVHHTGHTSTQRARGSTALKAALDTEWQLEKGKDELVRVECRKMKDAPLSPPMAYTIKPVSLGFDDERGRPVTSAVLEKTEWKPKPKKASKTSLGERQKAALDALRELVQASGDPEAAIPVDHWRTACMDEYGLSRQNYHQAKEPLQKKGLIHIEGSTVTLEE